MKVEYIYFENNPADPRLPHTMRDVNSGTLRACMWLECAIQRTNGKVRRLTEEEAKRIVSAAIPTSQGWSQTHKQVVCSFIPCPCCNTISLIVLVSSQGYNLNKPEPIQVDGWYQLDVSALEDGKFKVKTHRLMLEKKPLREMTMTLPPAEAET